MTVIRGGAKCTVSSAPDVEAIRPSTVIPPSCWRKSRWNHSRRNSPSVIDADAGGGELRDHRRDLAVLDLAQPGGVELAGAEVGAGGVDRRRAQQAADVVGSERGVDLRHRQSSSGNVWVDGQMRAPIAAAPSCITGRNSCSSWVIGTRTALTATDSEATTSPVWSRIGTASERSPVSSRPSVTT